MVWDFGANLLRNGSTSFAGLNFCPCRHSRAAKRGRVFFVGRAFIPDDTALTFFLKKVFKFFDLSPLDYLNILQQLFFLICSLLLKSQYFLSLFLILVFLEDIVVQCHNHAEGCL